VELTLVADLTRGQPDGREAAEVDQDSEAFGVELVGFVDVAHDDFGLRGVSQERDAPGLFDLI